MLQWSGFGTALRARRGSVGAVVNYTVLKINGPDLGPISGQEFVFQPGLGITFLVTRPVHCIASDIAFTRDVVVVCVWGPVTCP